MASQSAPKSHEPFILPSVVMREFTARAVITGVEGYVESTACGLLTALAVHARVTGTSFVPPPATTALGARKEFFWAGMERQCG